MPCIPPALRVGANPLFQSLRFVLEVVGFRRPVVQIKERGKDDLLQLGGLVLATLHVSDGFSPEVLLKTPNGMRQS
jgi:hypothetical protein